jgi:hypothetical protein
MRVSHQDGIIIRIRSRLIKYLKKEVSQVVSIGELRELKEVVLVVLSSGAFIWDRQGSSALEVCPFDMKYLFLSFAL